MVFAIHKHESATGIHVLPPSWNPSHLSPHPISMGPPRRLALGALLYALNLHWLSILQMVMYMFQGYSLKSSHSRLFLQSPKVYSLHLCLLPFPTCRITSQFSRSVMSNSLWPHGGQASLSIANSWSLLKPMSIKSVMPSNHLILCCPLLLPP